MRFPCLLCTLLFSCPLLCCGLPSAQGSVLKSCLELCAYSTGLLHLCSDAQVCQHNHTASRPGQGVVLHKPRSACCIQALGENPIQCQNAVQTRKADPRLQLRKYRLQTDTPQHRSARCCSVSQYGTFLADHQLQICALQQQTLAQPLAALGRRHMALDCNGCEWHFVIDTVFNLYLR